MHAMFYEQWNTPVRYACDVLVVGGGIAGVSAALAAARNNANVILVERSFFAGGLATAGLVAIYLPIADGYGRQASFGIAEELIRATAHCGTRDRFPEAWLKEGMTQEEQKANTGISVEFNPNTYAIVLEKLLLNAGVRILYGTIACAVKVENERVEAVFAENKSGRFAIVPQTVVDATGDADLWHLAGGPTACAEEKNKLAAWYCYNDEAGIKLKILGMADGSEQEPPLTKQRFQGIDGEELSDWAIAAHQIIMEDLEKQAEINTKYELACLASIPQVRMTRRIVGAYTLKSKEKACQYVDSIGMIANWRARGEIYEIPYGTLYSPNFSNMLAAGRCISASGPMWDICRVIPGCATTGQAAGVAAAMQEDVRKLSTDMLQKKLTEQGVVFH